MENFVSKWIFQYLLKVHIDYFSLCRLDALGLGSLAQSSQKQNKNTQHFLFSTMASIRMMMASLKNSSGSMNFHYRTIGALSSKLQRNTQRKCYHQETKTTLLEENNATNNSEKALSPKKEASFGVALYEKVFQFWKESSGTDEILILKEKVIDASRKFDIITQQVSNARRDVDVKFLQYQEVSKEHSSMLQSKDRWSPQDAQKFADLISDEIGRRKAWEEACEVLKISEERQGTIQVEYMDSMRKRYHEEQVWQEKWRILATYSTFALIFLNSSVFLISQIIHYRREAERFKAIESLMEEKYKVSVLSPHLK